MRRSWIVVGVGVVVLALAIVPLARNGFRAEAAQGESPSIARLAGLVSGPPAPATVLAGLDLTKITLAEAGAAAPLPENRIARLTIDPTLQRAAESIMTTHHIPEAAVVLMDVATGRVLVYASHIEKGPARDLCVEATAPAASVFKIVTGSTLVEIAGISPEQRECYSGGEQRILEKDLQPDPKHDKWCVTLAGAMGRSINTVFARLALRHLKPTQLEEMAKGLGFGAPLPFDVGVQPSAIHVPDDSLGFARTSAGFWNTTLSPLHAAWLSAMMARRGEAVRPHVVSDVVDVGGKVVWTAPAGGPYKRAIKVATAQAVTTMMDTTVTDGTSYRAFHDAHGQSFLPGIQVAGKTGTLTDPTSQRFYTWFTGFTPSHINPDEKIGARQVAIGVLVVNEPTWKIKANVLAREVLRAYFAEQKTPNVTAPLLRLDGGKKDKVAKKSERTETRD